MIKLSYFHFQFEKFNLKLFLIIRSFICSTIFLKIIREKVFYEIMNCYILLLYLNFKNN